jgi:hypothetical protein
VKRGVEDADLQRARQAVRGDLDPPKIERLVQWRQRTEGGQARDDGWSQPRRSQEIPTAMYDAMPDGGDTVRPAVFCKPGEDPRQGVLKSGGVGQASSTGVCPFARARIRVGPPIPETCPEWSSTRSFVNS